MFSKSNDDKHRLVFVFGMISILCAGILTMRTLGSYLNVRIANPDLQLHRYLTDLADGNIREVGSDSFIVLGDSTASRALPLSHDTTGNALSFAVQVGTLFDSYVLLRRYLRQHQPPPCLVLMTAYGATVASPPERFWSDLVGHNFYRDNELEELYSLSKRFRVFPARNLTYSEFRLRITRETLLNSINWQMIHSLIFKPHAAREARQQYRNARESRGSMPWQKVIGRSSVQPPADQSYLFRDFAIDPIADHVISQLAKMDGVQLLILNPPASERIRASVSEAWYARFDEHMKELASRNHSIRLELQNPWLKDIHFQDATHLNNFGNREFLHAVGPKIDKCVGRSSSTKVNGK